MEVSKLNKEALKAETLKMENIFNQIENTGNALKSELIKNGLECGTAQLLEILAKGIEPIVKIYEVEAQKSGQNMAIKHMRESFVKSNVDLAETTYSGLTRAFIDSCNELKGAFELKDILKIKGDKVKIDREGLAAYAEKSATMTLSARQMKAAKWLENFSTLIGEASELFHPVLNVFPHGSAWGTELKELSRFFPLNEHPHAVRFANDHSLSTPRNMSAKPIFENIYNNLDFLRHKNMIIHNLEVEKADQLGMWQHDLDIQLENIEKLKATIEEIKINCVNSGADHTASLHYKSAINNLKAMKQEYSNIEARFPKEAIKEFDSKIKEAGKLPE